MREQKNHLTTKILSNQLKEAFFLAFLEAKKKGNKSISSKLLLYAILKTNGSIASRNINNTYNCIPVFANKINKILNKCEYEFKKNNKIILKNDDLGFNFTRPVRRLLFLIIRSIKGTDFKIITTLHVFNYLVRNKSLKIWLKECLKKS